MKIFGAHAFINQVLVGVIVTLGLGGTAGLGTVWMRHQVSVVADTNRALQQQIADVDRRLSEMEALTEEEMSLDKLRAKNVQMQLGLVEMTQEQLQPVGLDLARQQFVARAAGRSIEREGATEVGIRFDTAPSPSAGLTTAAAGRPLPAGSLHPTIPSLQPAPTRSAQFAFTH